jgi:hypothetical protein
MPLTSIKIDNYASNWIAKLLKPYCIVKRIRLEHGMTRLYILKPKEDIPELFNTKEGKVKQPVFPEWQELKSQGEDYEININFPYNIRNRHTNKILKEKVVNCRIGLGEDANKYYCVDLGGTKVLKHNIVAEQFLENPDDKLHVNHISSDSLNNHISNLIWY